MCDEDSRVNALHSYFSSAKIECIDATRVLLCFKKFYDDAASLDFLIASAVRKQMVSTVVLLHLYYVFSLEGTMSLPDSCKLFNKEDSASQNLRFSMCGTTLSPFFCKPTASLVRWKVSVERRPSPTNNQSL